MSGTDPTFSEVLKEAFNVRVPVPMLGEVPINWLFIATAGVATLAFPPLGLITAGVELAILYGLTHNKRFHNYVKGRRIQTAKETNTDAWTQNRNRLMSVLNETSKARFDILERRAHKGLQTHAEHLGGSFDTFLEDGLERLQSIYLTLLESKEGLQRQVDQGQSAGLESELADAETRMRAMTDKSQARIAKSIAATVDILKRRLGNLATARQNVEFIESELRRIEHQTELVIEEAVLTKDPDEVAIRIDAVTSTFEETQKWIKENRDLMKEVGFDVSSTTQKSSPTKLGSY